MVPPKTKCYEIKDPELEKRVECARNYARNGMVPETSTQIQYAKDYSAVNQINVPERVYSSILRIAYRSVINTKLSEAKKCGARPDDAQQLINEILDLALAAGIDISKEVTALQKNLSYCRMKF